MHARVDIGIHSIFANSCPSLCAFLVGTIHAENATGMPTFSEKREKYEY